MERCFSVVDCSFILLTTSGPQESWVTQGLLVTLPRNVFYTDIFDGGLQTANMPSVFTVEDNCGYLHAQEYMNLLREARNVIGQSLTFPGKVLFNRSEWRLLAAWE